MTGLVLHADSVNCRMRGTRIMVALARYRRDHGAYPATLDELTPAYLREKVRDDFAPDGRFLGVYGKNDTTGLAWTTDAPGPNATWNSLSELGTTDVLLTSTVTLPDAARKTGVYLGIYFRNICVRGSVGVNMGYDDFKVVVK